MRNKKKKIYYTKTSISNLEISYAKDAVKYGWGDKCYEYIDKFEAKFKKHLNVKYSIATSSCTGALHMGMSALGIGRGDEIIMADINWIATASAAVHLGAKPVFVDILEDTWCIDPDKVEEVITPKTKAIVAVHLYGNLCNMNHLLKIGKKYGIPVIEDAAEAIGSVYKNIRAGAMGIFGTFSFHGSKTTTTGEGGMFVTNNKKLYEKVLTLSNHGRKPNSKKFFWPDLVGFKYKISNIQAAIGCAQIERVEELIKKKREILSKYKLNLKSLDGIKMNPEQKSCISGAWMPTIVFEKNLNISRKKIINLFKKENIDARIFFWPLSSLPMFKTVNKNINAKSISSRAINLPSFHDISDREIKDVCNIIKKCLLNC
jgi:perosamine synthetase